MNGAVDLSSFSMFMIGVLLLLTVLIVSLLRLGIMKNLLISTFRMAIQLVLVGFFLEFLFRLNNSWVNVLWFLVMVLVAVFSVLNNSKLNLKYFALPVFGALIFSNLLVVLYFNTFIAQISNIFEAQYIIAIGGMILGNSLRSNVIGLGDFYQGIHKQEHLYCYKLSLGASRFEAIRPFFKRSIILSIRPTLASMATMGIVSLPGMMTGQILGGSIPIVAIKYQIAIMIAILASTILSIALSLVFTFPIAFADSGMLNGKIFEK